MPQRHTNQVSLALHTAAFWVMHAVRSTIPKALIKIAARVVEHIARIGR